MELLFRPNGAYELRDLRFLRDVRQTANEALMVDLLPLAGGETTSMNGNDFIGKYVLCATPPLALAAGQSALDDNYARVDPKHVATIRREKCRVCGREAPVCCGGQAGGAPVCLVHCPAHALLWKYAHLNRRFTGKTSGLTEWLDRPEPAPATPSALFEQCELVKHDKSGGKYRVLGISHREADLTREVVYRSETDGCVFHRPEAEFTARYSHAGGGTDLWKDVKPKPREAKPHGVSPTVATGEHAGILAAERWTQLPSGGRNYRFAPLRTIVTIDDIAHLLGMKPRFGGGVRYHYSVAQHAVHVAKLVAEEHPTDYALQLRALHHDDAEAYLFDLEGPYKSLPQFAWFRDLESAWMAHIYRALDIGLGASESKYLRHDWWMEPAIHKADQRALVAEAFYLMPTDEYWRDLARKHRGNGWAPTELDGNYCSPGAAADLFNQHHRYLLGKLGR